MIELPYTVTPTWDLSAEEWQEMRQTLQGIGGSDIATILGLNKYQSRYALWAEKSGLVAGFQGNEATDWGHELEPVVMKMYAKKYNKAIVSWPVLLRSVEFPFLTANLDAVIVEPSDKFPAGEVTEWRTVNPPPGMDAVYEGKTGAIATPGKPSDWFVDGESVPDPYALQCEHYMGIIGLPRAEVGALIGGHGLLRRIVAFNETIIQDLRYKAAEFWEMVESGIPPEVDGSDATEDTLKAQYPRHEDGKVYEGGSVLLSAWEELEQAKIDAAAAETRRKKARADVALLLNNAEYGQVTGETILTFRASKDVERVDTDKLKRQFPHIYEECIKRSPGPRTLRGVN